MPVLNMHSSDDSEYEYLQAKEEEIRLYTNFYFKNLNSTSIYNGQISNNQNIRENHNGFNQQLASKENDSVDENVSNAGMGKLVQSLCKNGKKIKRTDNDSIQQLASFENDNVGEMIINTGRDKLTQGLSKHGEESTNSYNFSQKLTSFTSEKICVTIPNTSNSTVRRKVTQELNVNCEENIIDHFSRKLTTFKSDESSVNIKNKYDTLKPNLAMTSKQTKEKFTENNSEISNDSGRKRNVSICSSIDSISGREPLDNLYCNYYSDIEILDPIEEENAALSINISDEVSTRPRPYSNSDNSVEKFSDEETRCSLGVASKKLKKKNAKQKLHKEVNNINKNLHRKLKELITYKKISEENIPIETNDRESVCNLVVHAKQKLKKKATVQKLKKVTKRKQKINSDQDMTICPNRKCDRAPTTKQNKENHIKLNDQESSGTLDVISKQKLQENDYDQSLHPCDEIAILPTPMKHFETVTVQSDEEATNSSASSDSVQILQSSESKSETNESNLLHGKDKVYSRKSKRQSPDESAYLIASSSDDDEQSFLPVHSLTLNVSSKKTSYNRCVKRNSRVRVVKSQAIFSKVRPPTRRKPGCIKWTQEMSNMYDSDYSDELSVIDIHSIQSDSGKNWKICQDDIRGVQFRSQRYFRTRCTRCRDFGHTVMQCPRIPHCLYCGSTVHKYISRCPKNCCLMCGEQDHNTNKFCSKMLRTIICMECGERGHKPELCPDLWRRFHLTTNGVIPVKPNGDYRSKKMPYCYNCAKQGHYGHECKNGSKSKTHYLLTTEVNSYEVPAPFSHLARASEFNNSHHYVPKLPYREPRPFLQSYQKSSNVQESSLCQAGSRMPVAEGEPSSTSRNVTNSDDEMKKIVIYTRKQMKKLMFYKGKMLEEVQTKSKTTIKPRFASEMDTMTITGSKDGISTACRMMEFLLYFRSKRRLSIKEMKRSLAVKFR